MAQEAKPYTAAQLAGIEAIAALADQDTTIPRMLANLAEFRAKLAAVEEVARALRDPTKEEYPADVRDPVERTDDAIGRLLDLFPEEE